MKQLDGQMNMSDYVLCFKPAIGEFGVHDPSAVIFEDAVPVYGVEEERFTRTKHAKSTFPTNAIEACLDYCDIQMADLEKIILTYMPELQMRLARHKLSNSFEKNSIAESLYNLNESLKDLIIARFYSTIEIKRELEKNFETSIPPVEKREHHACHAASAFHPSGFDEALVLTVDGRGEYDSTVIWEGRSSGLNRVHTYEFPNSIGHFFGVITEYLGYRAFNGEGKIMGLAPYGSENKNIESKLRSVIDTGPNYDVTYLTSGGEIKEGVSRLENLFGRSRKKEPVEFTDWERDLAYTCQKLTEEIIMNIVERYCSELKKSNVALSGGVALNCKMNKQVMEMDCVDDVFIQPVAHDGGLALGAGMLDHKPTNVPNMSDIYLGPEYSTEDVEKLLGKNKISYAKPENLEKRVAEHIADGDLIGWFQGRLEMGPRALGNRSILADPRTVESRDRVNKYVKHREEWRPFAPSILEEAADEYFVNAEESPYMIKTFDTVPEKRDDIEAVLHPGDNTTRPQTVRQDQNPTYHRLIKQFEEITGVPVLLNTSFNDHAEPIVNTPKEAIKDFYGMGLDVLVINDILIEKDVTE